MRASALLVISRCKSSLCVAIAALAELEGEADEADGGDVDMLLPPPPLLLPPTFFFPPPPLPMPFLPPLGIEERACLALRDNEHMKRG